MIAGPYGYDGALDYGFRYAVAPNALNPFSPYTLQFNVEFSRSVDRGVLDFDRDAAVVGSATSSVPSAFRATQHTEPAR